MSLLYIIGTILSTSAIIYYLGKRFALSSSRIGDFLGLPRDVKGATFDAVSSSMPELLIALFSVIFFKEFEVGIGTIAGSALFNLLVIPGICVFVAPVAFKVSKKVIHRDAMFYAFATFVLMVLVMFFKLWGIGIALTLLGLYGIYIRFIVIDTKRNKKNNLENIKPNTFKKENINLSWEISVFFILLAVIGGLTYFLTEASINLAHLLNISPLIVAFTIVASATSVPDMVISITNAQKGDIDDAASNVFGSNVFDILVGIGAPLLIYVILKGDLFIKFENLEIILGLLFATIIVFFFFGKTYTLKKKQGVYLLLMYLLFIIYIVYLAFK